MPNHLHLIIILEEKETDFRVENFQPLQNTFQKIIPKSIGSIIKGLKIGVTKWFRQHTEIHKPWQRNYYDIIIRDEASYKSISRYVMANPKKWKGDQFYNDAE
jgi:REP element-mobilizing transposase RayT